MAVSQHNVAPVQRFSEQGVTVCGETYTSIVQRQLAAWRDSTSYFDFSRSGWCSVASIFLNMMCYERTMGTTSCGIHAYHNGDMSLKFKIYY